jgi:hypothetical protein
MTNEDYELFGLRPGASEREIKKAYRALAKKNHPDRFTDPEQKKAQEKKMARINDAYQAILAGKPVAREKRPEPEKETDTTLYKNGVEIYNRLNISIAVKIGTKEHEIPTVKDKIVQAEDAGKRFKRLLEKYPDSDWAYDSEEKLKNIPKYIRSLEENLEFLQTHKIGATKKGTPTWKKKKPDA